MTSKFIFAISRKKLVNRKLQHGKFTIYHLEIVVFPTTWAWFQSQKNVSNNTAYVKVMEIVPIKYELLKYEIQNPQQKMKSL